MTKIEKQVNTLVVVSIIIAIIFGQFELKSLRFIFVLLGTLGIFGLCIFYGFKILSATNIIIFTLLSLYPLGSILKMFRLKLAVPTLAFGYLFFVLVSIYIFIEEWKNKKRMRILAICLLVILDYQIYIWFPQNELKLLIQMATLVLVLWEFPYKNEEFGKTKGYLNFVGLSSFIFLVLRVGL